MFNFLLYKKVLHHLPKYLAKNFIIHNPQPWVIYVAIIWPPKQKHLELLMYKDSSAMSRVYSLVKCKTKYYK